MTREGNTCMHFSISDPSIKMRMDLISSAIDICMPFLLQQSRKLPCQSVPSICCRQFLRTCLVSKGTPRFSARATTIEIELLTAQCTGSGGQPWLTSAVGERDNRQRTRSTECCILSRNFEQWTRPSDKAIQKQLR